MQPHHIQETARWHREQIFARTVKVARRVTPKDNEAGYYPLHVRSVHPAVKMPFALFLKAVTPEGQEVRYIPFLSGGESLAAEWLTRLQALDIVYLYVQKDDLADGLDVFESFLEAMEGDASIDSRQKVAMTYDHLHLSLVSAASTLTLNEHLPRLSRQVDTVLKKIEMANLPFHLLWDVLLRDFTIYKHSVNVFFMAVAFMSSLRHRRADCQAMGMAALFHDVGLLKLPGDLAHKPGPLTAVEQVEYRKHPQMGHDLLSRYKAFPGLALRLVLEHHEQADGSGFPHNLDLHRQNPLSRILQMVDAYDLMTSQRAAQPGLKPFEALTSMKNQRGRRGLIYDHDLLNKFIRFIGT